MSADFEDCETTVTYDPILDQLVTACNVDMSPGTLTEEPIVFTSVPELPDIELHPGETLPEPLPEPLLPATTGGGDEKVAPTRLPEPGGGRDEKEAPSSRPGGAKEAPSVTATVIVTSTPTLAGNAGGDDDEYWDDARDGGGGGLAPGAVAGIAISTAIIGAAIAFLVAFLLFKRRGQGKRRSSSAGMGAYESRPALSALKTVPDGPYQMPQYPSHTRNISHASETGVNASTPLNEFQHSHGAVSSTTIVAATMAQPTIRSASAEHDHYLTSLGGILPPPAETSNIRAKLTAMFAQIHTHVETFYRDVHASITPSMEPELARFGKNTGDGGMAELLQNAGSPTAAIKHALVAYVIGLVSPASKDEHGEHDNGRSLFPQTVLGLASGELSEGLTQQQHNTDTITALTIYRRLSAHLYTTLAATHSSTPRTSVLESAQYFALTFFPWANPLSSDAEKDEDLVHIINDALDVVIWLYGTGQEFEWVWELEDGRLMRGEGDVVVRPGVVVGGVRVLDAVGGSSF